MRMTKRDMPETMYRASRFCRTLGNPTAYLIMRCIGRERKTPTRIAEEVGVHVATISITLRHLRDVDLVRYETRGNNRDYWLKDRGVLDILAELERWVGRMRKKRV